MGRVSRPNLTRLLRKDKERYKQLFEGSGVVKQPVKPMKVRIRTRDIINHRPIHPRRPRRLPKKPMMKLREGQTAEDLCEMQFPNAGHRRKVFGRTLKQLGVYDEIVNKKR